MLQQTATSDVLERADQLAEEELDNLPVGMIQLDTSGKILKFNQTESDLARVEKTAAVGRNFFDDVAPCTKVREFHGKFLDGVAARDLSTTFDYEFKFRDGRRKDVLISMFYSKNTESVWVLVQRP